MKNKVNGYYIVDNEIVYNKLEALILASKKNTDVKWWYFDEIFDSVNKITITGCSLESLYRERAKQIRDHYDYLILNYSGGSDSHNILHTFLKNDIKLDCIYVMIPEKIIDKGIYIPNLLDKSNKNSHSEWDFVIKKDLEFIKKYYPEIKIELHDWTTNIDLKFYDDKLFETNSGVMPSISRGAKLHTFSKTETEMVNKGKTVGSIFGVDKPNIVKKDNLCFFYFYDTSCMAQINPENPNGVEYFYMSPKFPELATFQAYKMFEWFRNHPDQQYLITAKSQRTDKNFKKWSYEKHHSESFIIAEIAKLVCYPYWDFNRFQAAKPYSKIEGLPMGFREWDNILLSIPDFTKIQNKWSYLWKSYSSMIDERFLKTKDYTKTFTNRWIYLGQF